MNAISHWISASLLDLGIPRDLIDTLASAEPPWNSFDASEDGIYEEDKYLGVEIPTHIYPLHFERNVNSTVKSIEKLERLASELHNFAIADVHVNYIGEKLKNSEEAIAIHRALSRQIETEKVRVDLASRLADSLVDVLQYYRATKIGFSLIYGHYFADNPDFDDRGNKSLSDLRRGMRNILNFHRSFSAKEQESVFSISLLRLKSSGEYTIGSAWKDGKRDHSHKGLNDRILEFDLRSAELPWEILSSRILQVGASVFDKHSGMKGFTGTEGPGSQSIRYQDFWNLKLKDGDDGIPIYPGKRAVLGEIAIPSAPGTRDYNAVRWVDNPRIINFPLARAWRVEIDPFSMLGESAVADYNVRDIILHFKLAHRIRGLS